MLDYSSDEELVEEIKTWWQTNGVAIIAGLAIGLAAIFGWRYWNAHQDTQAENASFHYDVLIQALEKNDAAEVEKQGEILAVEFSDSPYTVLAALNRAKSAVAAGDPAAAIKHMEWAVANADPPALKDIARLRLARALLAGNRLAEAEAQLDQVDNPNFYAEREELKGDLSVARDEPAQARVAYGAALAAGGAGGQNSLLQMKLDNLPPAEAGQPAEQSGQPEQPEQSEQSVEQPEQSEQPAEQPEQPEQPTDQSEQPKKAEE